MNIYVCQILKLNVKMSVKFFGSIRFCIISGCSCWWVSLCTKYRCC